MSDSVFRSGGGEADWHRQWILSYIIHQKSDFVTLLTAHLGRAGFDAAVA